MQEISAWFLVISVMLLFFTIAMRMYKEFFVNIIPVRDEDIHTSEDKIPDKKKKVSKKIKQNAKIKQIEIKNVKSRSNKTSEIQSKTSSKSYQSKFKTYSEYKKYNNISR